MKKKIVILGSTGSIGTQTLSIVRALPDAYEVLALSARHNLKLIQAQAEEFRPRYVGIADEDCVPELPKGIDIAVGEQANCALAALPEAEVVLIGISGIAGLPALLSALRAGKTVALANKESIVCGNTLIKRALKEYGGQIIPVDSEHSALFQCLQNGRREEVAFLHLTASGGPFWQKTEAELMHVTPEQALLHPVWKMGKKLTIDSATLFNKGLEIIEASYLFDMPNSQISVLIHPQSIVHSMVEYQDGALIAQLSSPDMRLPIQYALGYPNRTKRQIKRLSLPDIAKLTFFAANEYPAIRLAYAALAGGGHLPIVYNAANEAAVELFLSRRIGLPGIRHIVEYAMEHTSPVQITSLEDVMHVDLEARRIAVRKGME